jgi:ariadne-1
VEKKFCWKCGKKYHTPATCEEIETWETKSNSEDVLYIKWIQDNTKQCPNCKHPIEKNGGCAHMSCSRCYTAFCWLCRKNLNDPSADHSRCTFTHQSQSRPEFTNGDHPDQFILTEFDGDNPFLYYHEKYQYYQETLKTEDATKTKLEELFPKIENLCGICPEFILVSLEQLHINRCLLMNMFITLSQKKGKDAHLIATQAGTLEIISDKLANILEKQLNEQFIKEHNWVLKLKKTTRVARQFVQRILEEDIALSLSKAS